MTEPTSGVEAALTTLCNAVMADISEAKRRLDADIPKDAPVHPVSAFLTGTALHVGKARAALATPPASPASGVEAVRRSSGCFDRNGQELFVGDRIRYRIEGKHTKQEYWNPEYEIIFDPPCFSLKHVGGGKDGGNHLFILKCGGGNGDLELISRAALATPAATLASGAEAVLRRTEEREIGLRANLDEIIGHAHRIVSIGQRGSLRPEPAALATPAASSEPDLTVAYMAGFREAEKAGAERVAAERERCAVLVEDQMPATQDMESTEICEALERAAAAIRKETP